MLLKRVTALILALVFVLSLFACGNETQTESESESQTEAQTDKQNENKVTSISFCADDAFSEQYSDFEAMTAWLDKNIDDTDCPPVTFAYGKVDSDKMTWVKTLGEFITVTDYPESDNPVQRMYREVTYDCAENNLRVVVTYTFYEHYPVVEYDSVIINTANEVSNIFKTVYAVDSDIAENVTDEVTVHYNKGSTCESNDFEPYTENLSRFNLSCGEDGRPTNEYMPNINYEYKNGGGVIAVINWQAAWKLKSELEDGVIKFKAGQKSAFFQLQAQEEYNVPGIVLLFYKKGNWQEGQNIWRRWMIEHNLMRYTGRRDYTQNVYICSNSYNADNDIEGLKSNAEKKLGKIFNLTFEIDAGWYPEGLGNWYHTGNYYPGGTYSLEKFQEIAKVTSENDMGFGLWFEPERIYADTEEAAALGDNVIYLGNSGHYKKYSELKEKQKANVMGIVNYGVKEVEDYIVNMIDTAVKTYGLTEYRQDYNTSIQQYFDEYDKYQTEQLGIYRTGMTESHYCQGYINAWSRIAALNPGLVFDCCASGGRRMDLESMRYSFVHTKSDNWIEQTSQQCQNFALYSWNIFTGTSFQIMDEYDIRTRLTLSIAIDVWITNEVRDALTKWTAQQKYMYKDYYSLGEYSLEPKAVFGLQFNDPEVKEGMITVYFRRKNGDFLLKPKGLDPDTKYYVYDLNGYINSVEMTGAELMNTGIEIHAEKKCAMQIWYKPV